MRTRLQQNSYRMALTQMPNYAQAVCLYVNCAHPTNADKGLARAI